MNYYSEDSPKAIAEAIESIDLTESFDSRSKIQELDNEFVKNIKKVLEEEM